MKSSKSFLVLAILVISCSLVLRGQAIQLKFTAIYNGSHVDIDSVKVSNLTNPGDTILYWPDTTLLLGYVGIPDLGRETPADFDICISSTNPVVDYVFVEIYVPASGDVDICIADITGRLVYKIRRYLTKGEHIYTYSPNKQGISFISASYKMVVRSVKIMYIGSVRNIDILKYVGQDNIKMHPKSLTSTTSFVFNVGDNLQITGWYNENDTSLYIAPQTSTNYIFFFEDFCPGLPQFTYGGQIYHTVHIGTQCWMRENLNIGTFVPSVNTGVDHSDVSDNGIIEKYCNNNNSANCDIYGGLYDWNEIMQYNSTPAIQGICPSGWHIPTDSEWTVLSTFLGGDLVAGGKLKDTGFISWLAPNTGATNESGFTALGAGSRNSFGITGGLLDQAYFWTSSQYDSTTARYRKLQYDQAMISATINSTAHKVNGISLRCIKD